VIGAQWGDEGKGKITDLLSKSADIVVRYQGVNAGHNCRPGTNVQAAPDSSEFCIQIPTALIGWTVIDQKF